MSSGSSSSPGALPPKRPSQRMKLRNGTFIVPRTGERSRRQLTLRTSSSITPNEQDGYISYDTADTWGDYYHTIVNNSKARARSIWRWMHTDDAHDVMKCTFAYLLGSMGTFFPPLTEYLGHRDGKHITATLTVYFHPARTVGSMLEAILIAVIAVIYAEIISLISMGVSIALQAQLGLVAVAHAFILVFCIGGGLGFVGWLKQKLNSPLVNVGTTLTSIAIISVVTKEESVHGGYFSDDKIVQVAKMLVIGISFTAASNFLAWRVSARRVLRKSIITAAMSLSDKLSSITKGFLNGTEDELGSAEYARVTAQYNGAYALMNKTLREAKFELYFVGKERIYPLDRRLVRSMESLSQAIGGLRSALDTQFTLLKEVPTQYQDIDAPTSPISPLTSPRVTRALSSLMHDARHRLAVIDESIETDDEAHAALRAKFDSDLHKAPVFQVPSDIFAVFIELLGPSIKSLAYTLAETLREPAFGDDPNEDITVNEQLRESLRDALSLYNNARAGALQELYRIIEIGRSRSEAVQADIEEVAAACGHFSFSLQAVAEETDAYLDVLEDLKYTTETNRRSWNWLKFWRYLPLLRRSEKVPDDPERESLLQQQPVKRLRKSQMPKGIPDTMVKRRDTYSWDATPSASRIRKYLSQQCLKFMRFLVRDDILFGIKVGIGAMAWASLAFIPATRPVYQHWRGEWGLLSFMIVAGMTTGAANTTGTARFKGTVLGAIYACISWTVSQGNPIALVCIGGLVALGNFYVVLVFKNAPLGRTALLAYNVTTLYAYSLSQEVDDDDDDEGGRNPLIFEIAYHRVIAVTLGILWGIVVCRLLWPISGRRKFREGLSVLYLQMGLIWKRGPLGVAYKTNNAAGYLREGEQAALQRYAFKLDSLRGSAKSEFELRGPFPDAAYGRIMRSTKHILDGFYAMRLVTMKRGKFSEGERALLEFTQPERALLCDRICHVFQVLASCIMLEYPLTDAIPTVENNKDRLLGKIYQFRKDHMNPNSRDDSNGGALVLAEERDYALLYAYTLVTAQVAEELKKVRDEIEGLFGVLHEESLLLQ